MAAVLGHLRLTRRPVECLRRRDRCAVGLFRHQPLSRARGAGIALTLLGGDPPGSFHRLISPNLESGQTWPLLAWGWRVLGGRSRAAAPLSQSDTSASGRACEEKASVGPIHEGGVDQIRRSDDRQRGSAPWRRWARAYPCSQLLLAAGQACHGPPLVSPG